jgi:hypothetical protein
MKTLKNIIFTTILALALSVTTFAGEVQTPGYIPPPPPPPDELTATSPGEIPSVPALGESSELSVWNSAIIELLLSIV